MAKMIDWFPKIIICKIPEIIMLMIPKAGIIMRMPCDRKDKEKEFKDLWIVKAFQAYDGLINSRSKSQRPSDKE